MADSETFQQLKPQTSASQVDNPRTDSGFVIPKVGSNDNAGTTKKDRFAWFKKIADFSDPKRKKRALRILYIWGALTIIFLLLVLIPGIRVYKNGKFLYEQTQELAAVTSEQDLVKIKSELADVNQAYDKLSSSFSLISWTKYIPFLGGYTADVGHIIAAGDPALEGVGILVTAIEPYADIIGFKDGSESSGGGEETAEDRMDFVVKTIPSLIPKAGELANKAQLVQAEINQINPSRYPKKLAGVEIRDNVTKLVETVNKATDLVIRGKPLIEAAPYILGIEGDRQYFILFQNDKELRPTGGFMTAYSIAKVENGKFEPVTSNDIYNLDGRYQPTIAAPDPIIDYLKGPYVLQKNLRLRDINWSPDFSVAMETFVAEIGKVGVTEIDGIIAVDTQLLVNLLDVLGPIGVPGFGNYSTNNEPQCDCPQVIFELESFADIEGPIIWDPITGEIILRPPNSDNRKEIIGPLMNSILANTLGQTKDKIPDLFRAAFKSLAEKHIMFYMLDDKSQSAVEMFGVAGTIDEFEGDYLHINDANLGGRKSNLYVTQEVSQDIQISSDGTVTKTVTLTYNNPKEHDGWLNSVLPNWVRIYVPLGSELVDISGLEDKPEPYEDLGKTVFSGYFELRPLGLSKVVVTYTLPFKVDDEYKLLIQKQPGTDKPLYTISSGKFQDEFFLLVDKEIKFGI